MAREHAWFLDVPGTMYCHECRRSRPRVVYGPAARIAEIRAAIARGARALVDELVRRLHDPAPVAQPVDDPVENVPPAEPIVDRDAKPANMPIAELAERLSVKDETGAFLVRRGDVLDEDAVDFVYDACWYGTSLADWQEFYSERAAIFEYLAGTPRQVAEAEARQLAGAPPRSANQRREVPMASSR
jgi:hypothetical protein